MEGLEMICFEIIANVGNARSLYINAIGEAKNGNFAKAYELMKEGSESFANGHKAHSALVSKEAGGESVPVNIFLVHAEDQLMSAESFKILAEEFIDVYKKIEEK